MGFSNLPQFPPIDENRRFRGGALYAAAQAASQQLKAAPTVATESHYILGLLASSDTAGWIELRQDTGGADSLIGQRIWIPANGGGNPLYIEVGLKVATGKNIGVRTGIAGNHSVLAYGYTT